ncbi:amino acid racemase [Desulfobacula sp.]|uniref:aspartate/glutamate racemase family protein n=1 Tax=Desulfobacula sp. TaxID=2593537 RepID=UPI002603E363|nr:amino acid racemase [Desulfobacula sp.]
MKTIGIIGGLGPESTRDYYKEIIDAFTAKYGEMIYPEIIIYSVNINELMKMIETRNWAGMTAWLVEKIKALHRAGAEFAVIASNTPHIVFDDIRLKSPIPLLSIVEETCSKARAMNLKNLGLMGTQLTMAADFYKKPFIANGISVVTPSKEEQQFIQHKLFSEIELGIFKDATRAQLLSIAKRMKDEDDIDALILGCTELPLILTENTYGIPFLNTTAIHCDSIIKYCLEA